MKPITLTVAGLHSFREKQTVDFGSLCEGGVFGIFGPTGSGKSSILDAMTLALYGKVERASNNTHGILNHAENLLHVSFTFELENAKGAKRYTIERSFKRQDELKLKSSVSRIIEVGEESVVLADKIGEVNQCVQDLLGLTIDDFTRAVVLPQGKFAEFLSLKGADRRQMLQRLFNLEQYGDKLNKKLKNKLTTAKSELNEVAAEQAGLGDASTEAIKNAEQELKDTEILLEKRKNEVNKIEADFEKSKSIWQWQLDKSLLSKKMVEIEHKKPHILQLEQKVKNAETAALILPYIEEYESAKEALDKATIRYQTLQNQLKTKKQDNEAKANDYHHARQEKTEKLPFYLTKKQQLTDAKIVQEKAIVLEGEANDLQAKLNSLQSLVREKQKQIEAITTSITEDTEKQKERREKLSKLTVTAEVRDELQKANQQKQTILFSKTSVNEQKKDLENSQRQLEQLEKMLNSQNEVFNQAKHRMEVIFLENASTYEAVCDRERDSEKLIGFAEAKLATLKQALEDNRKKNLAIQIADQLQSGEPCPVCGSTHHPNPVSSPEDHGDEIAAQIEKLNNDLSNVRELKQEFSTLKLKLEQISGGLIGEYPGEMNAPIQAKKTVSDDEFEDVDGKLQALVVEQRSLQQDYLKLQEMGRKAIQDLRASLKQVNQLEQTKEINTKSFNELQARVLNLQEKTKEQYLNWKQSYPQLEFETIELKLEDISKNDKLAQSLSVEIENSTTLLEQKEQEKQKYQHESNELERQIVEVNSTLKGKLEALSEAREKLSREIGENNIPQLLVETEQMIKQLEDNESTAYEAWQKVQAECQKLENETHAALQAFQDGKSRSEKATSKWAEVLETTSFLQSSDVKESVLSKHEQEELGSQIERYWDRHKQVQTELQKLNDLLKGEELTQEKWDEIQRVRTEMIEMLNQAVEAKGAAVKALQVLLEKHERFNELEERRNELEQMVEQYNKLQSVFKGNSFVEFIAEEQLVQVSLDATERLGILTRQRYAVEVDSQGGFIMRDDANGGVRRPVTTLSGGETFLTSLALALSLSAQIQLRGEYPLQFFFLDEGFGTLDADLLDTVVSALEKLHSKQLAVGVISHVQELRARLPKRLIVEPAEPSGRGTIVRLETL
ncbi:SMC family ATPase [Fredinandcohnia sp. QZ13]|uniref:SMC family ATPase n=1 Tax=Fredinandcohnia sp. QZ13 TaxID=3073144 RepID=UPI0028533508|nr:SMC family ATPase [Fredinandcohnia sp. QZ13]MDR4887102.1 SMC family ATPase [Fredinandcohnia sp. QZ13]